MSWDPCIDCQGLSVIYRRNGTRAVDGIDLQVREGSVHGLLGPNGAGKTSLLSVLCGVMRPSSGSVSVLGHELPKEKEALKARIGVVPQEIALYPALTVEENLLYLGRMQGIPSAGLKEKVRRRVREFHLVEKKDERIDRLSGGMKRRVNLMAGILHEPELLFLDEPTAGIDVHSRGMILERLMGMREEGVTLLYTSHDLEEAQELCDRISVMDGGRIVKEGDSRELAELGGSGAKGLRELLLEVTGSQEDASPS